MGLVAIESVEDSFTRSTHGTGNALSAILQSTVPIINFVYQCFECTIKEIWRSGFV